MARIEVNDENIYTQTLEKIQCCECGEFVRVFLEIPLNLQYIPFHTIGKV